MSRKSISGGGTLRSASLSLRCHEDETFSSIFIPAASTATSAGCLRYAGSIAGGLLGSTPHISHFGTGVTSSKRVTRAGDVDGSSRSRILQADTYGHTVRYGWIRWRPQLRVVINRIRIECRENDHKLQVGRIGVFKVRDHLLHLLLLEGAQTWRLANALDSSFQLLTRGKRSEGKEPLDGGD